MLWRVEREQSGRMMDVDTQGGRSRRVERVLLKILRRVVDTLTEIPSMVTTRV